MTDAHFHADGDWLVPTDLTRSPWGPEAQHGGPSLALLVRAAEGVMPPTMGVWRVTAEILRPIPHRPLRAGAAVVRPGRRVTLIESTVEDRDGPVMLGRVWAIRHRDPLSYPEPPDPLPEAPPGPEHLEDTPFAFAPYTWFGDSLQTRLVSGAVDAPGAATVWFRLRVPVVAGEEPTAVQRLATMVDSGNGISWGLSFGRYLFINSDVSMYLLREPAGEWVAMASVSHYDPSGRGIAETRLFDQNGYLGRSQQALFVDVLGAALPLSRKAGEMGPAG
ncbi:MAG: thioesterase family protein [Actinobacteria bacterium]|nr:thioesterase family protein [Actinomycetota bacterium]